MNEGWVKIHRELLYKPIWLKSTPEQKTILITILLMANHKGAEWEWQGKKFKVYPGQFVTSLDGLVKQCGKGITIQNVRSALKKFEKFEFLTNKSTKTGRLISVVNWGIYQDGKSETNKDGNKEVTKNQQRGNKEVTKNQQRGNKEVTPNKNDKNKKNDKNDKYADAQEIFNYWNESNAGIKHGEVFYNNNKNKIKTYIKKYGKEEIIKCVKRLSLAVNKKDYFYNNRWNIINFFKQENGIKNWQDEGQLWNQFKDSKESKTEIKKEYDPYANMHRFN